MKWTNEKPKVPGWYWFLKQGSKSPSAAFVELEEDEMTARIGMSYYRLDDISRTHQWSDQPIPEPTN